MEVDAFFTIGKAHTVCQDYALADRSPGYAGVLLSDGCSSSPHTDVGARVLCWTWRDSLREAAFLVHQRGLLQEVVHVLPWSVPATALDGTLMAARVHPVDPKHVAIWAWGDGAVLARARNGIWWSWKIEYPSGAPLYLNYLRSETRLAAYLAQFGAYRRVTITGHGGWTANVSQEMSSVEESAQGPRIVPFTLKLPIRKFDVVLLCSDGIASFQRPKAHGASRSLEAVPMAEVARELLAIKTPAGAFVTRRVRAFLREADAWSWQHDDDFAVAGIFLPSGAL